jgi:hypothetical protein
MLCFMNLCQNYTNLYQSSVTQDLCDTTHTEITQNLFLDTDGRKMCIGNFLNDSFHANSLSFLRNNVIKPNITKLDCFHFSIYKFNAK